MINHPCLSCGACCAFFRVSFHWSEVLTVSHAVPKASTEKISLHTSAMNGTNQKNPRCDSLNGIVGQAVTCDIYLNRPSPCRTFAASFEDGTHNERCDRARTGKGLELLTLSDWPILTA
jgi:Fe-S-cluster containining protein